MKNFKLYLFVAVLAFFGIAMVTSPDYILRDYTLFGSYQRVSNEDYSLTGFVGNGGEQLNSVDGKFRLSSGYFAQVKNVPPTVAMAKTGFFELNNISTESASVEWNIVSGVNSYQIQWDSASVNKFSTPVGDVTLSGTSFTFPELAFNSEYYWRVRAISPEGVAGEWSNEYPFTTKIQTPVITEVEYESTIANVKWNKVEGADEYLLLLAEPDKDFKPVENSNLSFSGESASISGLTPGETYSLAILAAKNNWGISDTSEVSTFVMKSATVTSLSVLPTKVNNSTSKLVQISWSNPLGKWDSIKIERKRKSASEFVLVANFASTESVTTYQDRDDRLLADTEYDYKISSINSAGEATVLEQTVLIRPDLPILSNLDFERKIQNMVGDTVALRFRLSVPTSDTSAIRLFYSIDAGETFNRSNNFDVVNDQFTGTQNLNLEWYSAEEGLLEDQFVESLVIKLESYVTKYDDFNSAIYETIDLDNQPPQLSSSSVVVKSVPWNKLVLEWSAAKDSSAITYSVFQTSPQNQLLEKGISGTTYTLGADAEAVDESFAFEVLAIDAFGNSASISNLNGDTRPSYVGDYNNDGGINAVDLLTFALSWGGDEGGVGKQTTNLYPYEGEFPRIQPTLLNEDVDVKDLATFIGMWNSLISSSSSKVISLTTFDENDIETVEVKNSSNFVVQPEINVSRRVKYASFEIQYDHSLVVDSITFKQSSPFKLSYQDTVNSRLVVDFVKAEGWVADEEPVFEIHFSKQDNEDEDRPRFSIRTEAGHSIEAENRYSSFKVFEIKELPQEFLLSQNYPNPFNPSTKINFALPVESEVTLMVYDVLGREVATLVSELKTAGTYSVTFDAGRLSSGVYFYRITAGEFQQIQKMMLIK